MDPDAPAKLIVGLYRPEDDNEKILMLNKIFTAVKKAEDETIQKVELRFHDRESNEVERNVVTKELYTRYNDRQLDKPGFIQEFEIQTPPPSPTPSHTPTPELEEGESRGMGMYGMGMYGMGMYGMGMGGMMAPGGG